MIPARIIERKRDGGSLAPEELRAFFLGYLEGEVEEHQMAALLMAVFFRGLAPHELDALVDVMVGSGEVLDLRGRLSPVVDKHSTGGVGDKASLPLAPLAAELGLYVPMLAGRGLGHTGGTLDKLESVPGFRTDLGTDELLRVVERVGVAITGQTAELAPLDRRLYALRDVTGTVSSIPLIAASIMSKKLAEDLDGLVLDVKVGEGAFIPEGDRALELARTMVGIGARRGVSTRALLTAMDRPLGRAVGNALEVLESIECLKGGGPPDLRHLVIELAAEMLAAGGSEADLDAGRRRAAAALDGGGALARFAAMIEAQGGDPRVVDDPSRLPSAPETGLLQARRSGVLAAVVPSTLGYGLIELGGGRKRLGERIDPRVGFVLHAHVGQSFGEGEVLATVHAADPAGLEAGLRIAGEALLIADPGATPPAVRPLISHRVLPDGSVEEVAAGALDYAPPV